MSGSAGPACRLPPVFGPVTPPSGHTRPPALSLQTKHQFLSNPPSVTSWVPVCPTCHPGTSSCPCAESWPPCPGRPAHICPPRYQMRGERATDVEECHPTPGYRGALHIAVCFTPRHAFICTIPRVCCLPPGPYADPSLFGFHVRGIPCPGHCFGSIFGRVKFAS